MNTPAGILDLELPNPLSCEDDLYGDDDPCKAMCRDGNDGPTDSD